MIKDLKERNLTIKFAKPLSKNVYISLNKDSKLDIITDDLETYFKIDNDYFDFHLNLKIEEKYSNLNQHIYDLIKFSRKFRITHEKSFPKISIFLNPELLSSGLIQCIKSLDNYCPHITLEVVINESYITNKIDYFTKEILGLIGDDLNVIFIYYISKDFEKCEEMYKKAIETANIYKNNDAISVIFDVFPGINMQDAEIDKMLTFLPRLKNTNTILFLDCGLMSIIYKFILNYQYMQHNSNTYSFQCGLLNNNIVPNENIKVCPYFNYDNSSIKRCFSCEFLDYCSGCLINPKNSICNFRLLFDNLLKKLKSTDIKLEDFTSPMPNKIEIRTSDWDYLVDSFDKL
ncbi:hypothetical protein METP3_01746 [Methanosarcinales archaeon]|nr:hypothetical protein METP3_01746 [Methanosarcinales archaeon]